MVWLSHQPNQRANFRNLIVNKILHKPLQPNAFANKCRSIVNVITKLVVNAVQSKLSKWDSASLKISKCSIDLLQASPGRISNCCEVVLADKYCMRASTYLQPLLQLSTAKNVELLLLLSCIWHTLEKSAFECNVMLYVLCCIYDTFNFLKFHEISYF